MELQFPHLTHRQCLSNLKVPVKLPPFFHLRNCNLKALLLLPYLLLYLLHSGKK
jgi:hypothetical protein